MLNAIRLVALSISMLLLTVVQAQPKGLTLCYEDQDYTPYLRPLKFPPPNDEVGFRGVLPDMAMLAAQELEMQINFLVLPWKRCIEYVRQGKADGMFAAVWKSEREAWGRYPKDNDVIDKTKRLWSVDYYVYTYPESGLEWDGTSFSGVRSGIDAPLGYVTYDKLNTLGVLSEHNNLPDKGFQLLSLKRLDGYVLEKLTADNLINRQKLTDQVSVLPSAFHSDELYLPFSYQWFDANPMQAGLFWDALARIRENNVEQLIDYYRE